MEKVMHRLIYIILLFCVFSFTAQAEDAKPEEFAITATAFLDKGILPILYTCDGKDKSPGLAWSGVPAKTESFALIMEDRNAPNSVFYHWVLYNIPKNVTTFPEELEKLPAGVMVGKNSFDKQQYNGPCPPKGAAHSYVFTLYALNSKLTLPAGADAKAVLDAIKNHLVGKAEISVVYSRWLT